MATPQYVYVMTKLNKTYPGGKQVLKDVTLAFLPGAKIGVVGVNGSGKSTLLRIMAGEETEFVGEAWAADIRRTRNIGDFRDWKKHDAYQKAFERLIRDLKQEAEKGVEKKQAGS